MNELIDFSACPLSSRNLQYGGRAGEKRGILYKGEPWILKFPKNTIGMRGVEGISYVTSPLNEFIGSRIFELLGYESQETLLGVCFDGKRYKPVCACKDFIGDENEEILVPYTAIRNDTSPLVMERNDCSPVAPSNINEVIFQLKHNEALSKIANASAHFFEAAIVDLLINNNDRNEDNWGLIKNKKTLEYRFAPIYDCGNSFNGKCSEEKIAALLSDPGRMESSALNGITAYENDEGGRITISQFLKLDNEDLRNAVVSVYEKASSKFADIEGFILSIPHEFKETAIITENRAKFYVESLRMRLKMTLRPCYEAIVGKGLPQRGK